MVVLVAIEVNAAPVVLIMALPVVPPTQCRIFWSQNELETQELADNESIWRWVNQNQKQSRSHDDSLMVRLWRTCLRSVNASFDLNRTYIQFYLRLKCFSLDASAAEDVKLNNSPVCIMRLLVIHNITCYHSRVQEVRFKWGQVRIRRHGGWAPLLMWHHANERAARRPQDQIAEPAALSQPATRHKGSLSPSCRRCSLIVIHCGQWKLPPNQPLIQWWYAQWAHLRCVLLFPQPGFEYIFFKYLGHY